MKTKSITKATLLSIFVLSVITAVTLNSCQKESIRPKVVNSSTKAKGEANTAEITALFVNDINNMIFSMKKNQKGFVPGGVDSNGCVTIVTDTIDKPNSITYNYGSNCIGSDGKVRSGVVVISYAVPDIKVVNNVITGTMQNYTINGTLVNGTISMTNIGTNGSGNLVLLQSAAMSKLAPQQINSDSLTANFAYEWISGESSSPASNWQFSITGGWTSSYTSGQTDSLVITTPLIKNAKNPGCNFTITGKQYTVTTTPMGLQYSYYDYSNPGSCSGQVAVTTNGTTVIQSQNQ
jgi:hypothetical protein